VILEKLPRMFLSTSGTLVSQPQSPYESLF
jgi:hypothetical protein